ncbi:RNA polymerase sigma factor [Wenyingzhuangia sp. 2_MG-2023]|uniref:RNA polymerase sigma factor n=1 Tax=Wenyingzhuangia sp. 2_MG-2023 TaxID=3062639 RepID=UPI0026E1D7BE|nr:RNA polymerase sigma factor [Wenyingzhuangia sp. 2_MG-2023]MDO6736606.1 RNA polymerase sigma factor [Wenyingzhuangia sp. 2_MG-2023]MDO6801099.1 RNA polymerase sigma factor [Wenyingzhuangia sp. 1_MG-2023]
MSKKISKQKAKEFVSFSDEELMKLFALENNELAFEEVYKRYFNPLTKYIGWMAKDIDLSKDIVQGVFSKLYSNPKLYNADENFKTWVYVTAKNKLKNEWRNVKNRDRILSESQFLDQTTSSVTTDDSKMLKVIEALKHLSESHKDVFVLKYSSNLSIKEISEIYKCSEGTVKSRLFYAMKKIKEIMNVKNQ